METQGCSQVRRLHIVYFLSRKGRIEHPHLIRVHHFSRNGVRLRDVKRWLGELRGKDLPETFSWSYKRRYKAGYVWQDLLDDDLINPISDNEYVLKGSDISSTTIKDYSKVTKQNDKFLQENTKTTSKEENQSHNSSETSMYISTKSSSEIQEESPNFGSDASTLTDDSIKAETEKTSGENKHEKPPKDEKDRSSPFYSTFLSKKNKKRQSNKVTIDEKISKSPEDAENPAKINTSSSSSEPQLSKNKSINSTNGASNMFRNLITCGALDTNDSAVVPINKQNNNKHLLINTCSKNGNSSEICKRDKLGGSQRVFGNPHWTQHQWSCGRKSFDGVKDTVKNKSELREQRAPCSAYMPVNGPNCSQCGKPFKPEKLHAHMKSCKGIKALFKDDSANAAISTAVDHKASKGPIESHHGSSVSGHLVITH